MATLQDFFRTSDAHCAWLLLVIHERDQSHQCHLAVILSECLEFGCGFIRRAFLAAALLFCGPSRK